MTLRCLCLFSATMLAAVTAASAAIIPYSGTGANPEVYSFTAANSGDVTAYFYTFSGASYTETLGLEINGVPTGITGLNNHTSVPGQSLVLGRANAGDVLTFFINVLDTGSVWYSNPALNIDRTNHIYSTSFGGSAIIPAGTYVGFEDLAGNVADYNYADEQFVFPNTALIVATPEPSTWALAGFSMLAWLAIAVRKRIVMRGVREFLRS
jgi:hypothetical protein